MPTANEIRQQFLDFFARKHGHTIVPSSPVVPQDDPTLLFTNAGMNQFKDVFLGTGTRPYKRAVDTQKCIRAGGKHNDLDDVGKDTYHHTFFEMLGNWSFGDYFKKEAIRWAWELLTKEWKLDKARLHATVFEGSPDEGVPRDEEAHNFWKSETDIDPSHIHFYGKKDNFWEMGETGPCGPCSEIHYDKTPNKSGSILVNAGSPDVIEIWNLVFIQFNSYYPDPQGLTALQTWDATPEIERAKLPYRSRDEIVAKFRKLSPLPAKHVDTGMGFERVTAVLQGKESNYDTDVFSPIMNAIARLTGKKYGGKLDDMHDVGFRAIADHLRMATFAITDGARPGNKKRDAVLRSVIRRAVRFGYQCFDLREPFVWKLVPVVVEEMGDAFPELKRNPKQTADILCTEEADFLRTIERGLLHFHHEADSASGGYVGGGVTASLHTTYGFPIDLTEQMAAERGLRVDRAGYEIAMEEHRQKSGQGRQKIVISAVSGVLPKTDDSPKYGGWGTEATVLGWIKDNQVIRSGRLEANEEVALLLDRTSFYAEQGGQVGDFGEIGTETGTFVVEDTQKLGDAVLHIGYVEDDPEGNWIECGRKAFPQVNMTRINTMRNHTATHLLNWALRNVLGTTIDQKGSLVDAEKTRFDFTHEKALSQGEIKQVEKRVNERIYADLPVTAVTMPLAEAKKIPGVRAVFGEKYPDPVRVLAIGVDQPAQATDKESVEFCGGTHVQHTGQIGFFKIVSQEPVSKGVRRVTAVTGRKAVETVQSLSAVVDDLTGTFNCKPEELPARVATVQDEIKKLQQQLKKGAATDLQSAADKLFAAAADVASAKLIIGEMPAGPAEAMRQQVDRLRQKAGSAVVVIGWPTEDGKVQLMAAVTEDLVKKGLHAGKLVGQIAKVVGGGGGGKPTMAEAGGKEPAKLGESLELARKLAAEQLAKVT